MTKISINSQSKRFISLETDNQKVEIMVGLSYCLLLGALTYVILKVNN